MTGRVLIIDDIATNRMVLSAMLRARFFEVSCAENGRDGLRRARKEKPDIILLDCLMPGLDGWDICRRLKADPDTAGIAVVMLTGLDAPEARLQALRCGADEFLTRPVAEAALFARLRRILRDREEGNSLQDSERTIDALNLLPPEGDRRQGTHHLLLVGAAGSGSVTALQTAIARGAPDGTNYRLRIADPSELASKRCISPAPEAILLDATEEMRDDDALQLLTALKRGFSEDAPAVLFVTGRDRVSLAARALDLGAHDLVLRPFATEELHLRLRSQIARRARRRALRQGLEEGLRLAMRDPLTELHNRRYADTTLRRLAHASVDRDMPVSVLIIDIDHFKGINDRHGHSTGDKVLRDLAAVLRANLRDTDLLARIGGEEFLVAVPEADLRQAARMAERLRRQIEAQRFTTGQGQELAVTVSIGVAQLRQGETIEALCDRADRAMLDGKTQGRNRVVRAAQEAA